MLECACLLTNASVGSSWYHDALKRSHLTCLLSKRLKFWGPNSAGNSAAMGQSVMLFLGEECEDPGRIETGFSQHFGELGWVAKWTLA